MAKWQTVYFHSFGDCSCGGRWVQPEIQWQLCLARTAMLPHVLVALLQIWYPDIVFLKLVHGLGYTVVRSGS